MLSCKSEERGCFVCYCKNCNAFQIVPFGCNSRLCSPCGKRYTDEWAERLARKVAKGVIHRHLVFTLPDILWPYIKENRQLQQTVSEAAYQAIVLRFSRMGNQQIMPGVIAVVHPFGKDLGFKPHVHCIVTEGGFTNDGRFHHIGGYIHYDSLHKEWQYVVLQALNHHIPKWVISSCYLKYDKGFCAYVKPERIWSHRRLAQYIGRYVRHPAIANSRLDAYNGEAVRFYYEDHERKRCRKVMLAHDFITALIQHIPEKNFRLIRYYGAYARRKKPLVRMFIKQSTIQKKLLVYHPHKKIFYCSFCDEPMDLVWYCRKPPPKEMSKISTRIDSFS